MSGHDIWLEMWREGRIPFHRSEVGPELALRWPDLGVPEGARVFVPLAGKSVDMAWLRSRGHEVVAVDVAEIAAREFFAERGLEPDVAPDPPFLRFEAGGFTYYAGDFFDLDRRRLGGASAFYDRAALVALPPDVRVRYAERMAALLPAGARGLLLTIDYPQSVMEGPPFSVGEGEVRRLYGGAFRVEKLSQETREAAGHLVEKGLRSFVDLAFALERRS